MSLILLVETATTATTVGICRDGTGLLSKQVLTPQRHTEDLLEILTSLLQETGLNYTQLDAIAVSAGPGSYTGLRIGVSFCKGLCYALDIPLIGVSTLEIMAAGFLAENSGYHGFVCPMIDARRMEVYLSVFDQHRKRLSDDLPVVLDEELIFPVSNQERINFIGSGVQKSIDLLAPLFPNAKFDPGCQPAAINMSVLAQERFSQGKFEDLAWFEPAYLKPFQGIRKV
jgi:tRNA threonylcarbamoyladenosine biosynthesis protein TsaB